jgi:hypothetical protein
MEGDSQTATKMVKTLWSLSTLSDFHFHSRWDQKFHNILNSMVVITKSRLPHPHACKVYSTSALSHDRHAPCSTNRPDKNGPIIYTLQQTFLDYMRTDDAPHHRAHQQIFINEGRHDLGPKQHL